MSAIPEADPSSNPSTANPKGRDSSSAKPGVKQLTVRLSDAEVSSLKALAERENVTATSALKRAIATETYIREKQDLGATILVKERDGTIKEVVFR